MNPYLQYFQSEPAFQQEYERVKAAGDTRTPEQWMQAHIAVSPQDKTKFDAMVQGNQTTSTIPNNANNGNTGNGNTATVANPPGFGTSLTDLVNNGVVGNPALNNSNSIIDAANQALNSGATRAQQGGNTNQVQGGTQTGQYQNAGETTTNTAQTGTQQTTGTQTGGQQTSGTTTGTTTTGVDDKFGLGGLLQQMITQAGPIDAARNKFLQQTMQQGDPALQGQVDQAVRNSLSGPQMSGAGESARARAAGYAAANVGRNSLQSQLQASQQLAQPGQSNNVIASGIPLSGQTQTTSQTSLGETLNNLTSNQSTTSAQDTTGKQSQTGSGQATGSSVGVATGQIPQQTQSGGGCVVCTAYVDKGQMSSRSILRAVAYKLQNISRYETSLRGYAVYGPRLALAVLDYPLFAKWFKPIVRAILWHENTLALPSRFSRKRLPVFWHFLFHYGSIPIGYWNKSNIDVRNGRVRALLEKHNLMFHWRVK